MSQVSWENANGLNYSTPIVQYPSQKHIHAWQWAIIQDEMITRLCDPRFKGLLCCNHISNLSVDSAWYTSVIWCTPSFTHSFHEGRAIDFLLLCCCYWVPDHNIPVPPSLRKKDTHKHTSVRVWAQGDWILCPWDLDPIWQRKAFTPLQSRNPADE